MSNSVDLHQKKLEEDFEILESWEDRYRQIIDLGRKLPDFPEDQRIDSNLVQGCQSRVWIYIKFENNKVKIFGDSDAHITKGLVALLINLYDDAYADEIATHETDLFLKKLNLHEHLSPTRSNGLNGMVNRLKILTKNASSNY